MTLDEAVAVLRRDLDGVEITSVELNRLFYPEYVDCSTMTEDNSVPSGYSSGTCTIEVRFRRRRSRVSRAI